MVTPYPGSVVIVRFPFSDLTSDKLRPAVVLASSGKRDWILCQITSNQYHDPGAIPLEASSFAKGTLNRASFVRPGKLFTANVLLMAGIAGQLSENAFKQVRQALISLIEKGR